MTSRRFTVTLVAVMLALLCALPARAQQSFTGTYVVDSAASDDINAAIDAATARMNFIKKPIARKRLRATNPPTRTIVIRMVADSVDLVVDSAVAMRTKPNAGAASWSGFHGEPLTVTTTFHDDVLGYLFDAKDGRRQNRYRLRADSALELNVTLTSPRLPEPVKYTRVFRRAGE